MRYFTRVAGRDFELDVRSVEGGVEIRLDDRTYRVDLAAVEEGANYSVLVDRRSFSVTVDGEGQRLHLNLGGHAYEVDVQDERERAVAGLSAHAGAAGGVVESVMPGIVRKVFVAPGTTVAAGDRLLILEAMKMENEIRAEGAGTVEQVHVKEGQAVERGQKLLTLV